MNVKTDPELNLPVPTNRLPGSPKLTDDEYVRWTQETRKRFQNSTAKCPRETPVPVRFVML